MIYYINTYQVALVLLEEINKTIINSGIWNNTVTNRLCYVLEIKGGNGAIPIVEGYEQFYPEYMISEARELNNNELLNEVQLELSPIIGTPEMAYIINGSEIIQIETENISIVQGEFQRVKEWIFSQNFDLSGITLWQDLIGQFVKKGKLVVHNAILYIVDGPHTFQSDWPPNLAISLFSTHWPDGVIGPWRQPNGAHDSYKMGMRVTHTGWIWEVNQVDANGHNVWEPGVFGWINIGQVNQPEEPPDEPPANPCDSIAVWDSTQDWDSYVTGELRKWEIGGVMKVFSCNSKEWAYIEPGQPYSGWKYEYDCPTQ